MKFTKTRYLIFAFTITFISNGDVSINSLAEKDLIIEAVFENMDLKKEIFSKLNNVAKKGAILATNTSGLDINEIASTTDSPENVIGLHFFSPANVMKLLEIVRGEKTSNEVIATSMTMAKSIILLISPYR